MYKEKSIVIFVQLLVQYSTAGQTSKILSLQSLYQDTYVYFTLICNKQQM